MTNQLPDATKMVLSPAAQAVMDAAVTKITLSKKLAAALRAAVDQVVPETKAVDSDLDYGAWEQQQRTRAEILTIAAELEATND